MDGETFRTRISRLIQRSRKALRLYSTVGRSHHGESGAEFSEMQVNEWKAVNAELVRQLIGVAEEQNNRKLVADLFAVRDRFQGEWRLAEAELHKKQKLLCAAGESADFVKAALLSKELVALKSRMQAAQAAQHEINEVIRLSHVVEPQSEAVAPAEPSPVQVQLAKVIPLTKEARRR